MTIEIFIAIGGLACSIIAIVINHFWIVAKVATTVENSNLPDAIKRLTSLEAIVGTHGDVAGRLGRLEARFEMLWSQMEPALKAIIHHPDTPRKDELIEKFPNLNVNELCELRHLVSIERDELTIKKDLKVFIYALMLARIEDILEQRHEECKEKI